MNGQQEIRPAEDIQRELAELRSAIVADVKAVASDARTLTDWRYHFRKHPWLCCAGAAAVGYWMVPTPRRGGTLASAGMLDRVISQAAGDESPVEAGTVKSGTATAVDMLASLALRHSLGFLASYGRDWLERQALAMAQAARAAHSPESSREEEEYRHDQSLS